MNTQKKRKGKVLKRILGLALAVSLIGGGAWYFLRDKVSAVAEEYTEYTASIGNISNAISLSGTFAAVESKTYTASAAANIREVYVSAGAEVKQGDKLVRLSNGETLKADFDGRVNSVLVANEEAVSAGTTLLQVANFDDLQISVSVDEYDISKVSVGQQCLVTATASGQVMVSSIDSISYISSVSTGSVAYYTAVVKVEAPEGVYPGMQASVVITQEEASNVVLLRQSALSFDERNQAYVLMKNAAGENEQVSVTVGVSNGYYVEIKSGLNDGAVVYARDDGTGGANAPGMNMMMFGMGGGGAMPVGMPAGERRIVEGGERRSMPGGGE